MGSGPQGPQLEIRLGVKALQEKPLNKGTGLRPGKIRNVLYWSTPMVFFVHIWEGKSPSKKKILDGVLPSKGHRIQLNSSS